MSTKVLTTSQLTFVDITDQRKLSAYLTSNLPTVQTLKNGVYSPDWRVDEGGPLKITPKVFIDQTPLSLTDTNLTMTWTRRDGNGAPTSLKTGETATKSLEVSANKLADTSTGMLTYVCEISYFDTETEQTITITDQLTYTLIKGAPSCSISGQQIFKYNKDNEIISGDIITLDATVHNANIVNWQYYNAAQSAFNNYPDSSYNTKDEDGYITSSTLIVSHNDQIFSNGVAKIKLITDHDDTTDIFTITKIKDGPQGAPAYTVLLTNESHIFPGTVNTAKASTASTQVIAFQGATTKTPTITKVASIASTSFDANGGNLTEYTGLTFKVSGTTITFTTTNALTTSSGSVPIEVSVDGNTYKKMFSWSVAYTGTGACSLHIEASSQIFKSSDGTVYTPANITLTPHVQNLTLSSAAWTYSTSGGAAGTWKAISTQSTSNNPLSVDNTSNVLTIPNNCSLFTDTITSIVLKCAITNGTGTDAVTYADTVTIARLSDGQSAEAAYTVILGNEMQNIATSQTLYPESAQTFTCPITVFEGLTTLTAIAPTETPGEGQFKIVLPSDPTGITLDYKTNTDQTNDYDYSTVTFSVNPDTPIAASGQIELAIYTESNTTSITKIISYAASKSGVSSVTFMLWAPYGDVFSNQTGTLPLEAQVHYGATDISDDVTYTWSKYTSGSYQVIKNADDTNYTSKRYDVPGSEVVNIQTYKCEFTYNGTSYSAVYTMADMSDTYVSEMLTIGGTTFKNNQGGSVVYVVVRSNGIEKDPFPANCSIGPTPTTIRDGDYWWRKTSNGTMELVHMYQGQWRTATDPQQFNYTWSLMDKDGNADNTFGTKTGKVIYLSCSDIHSIGTLQCDVSTKETTATS